MIVGLLICALTAFVWLVPLDRWPRPLRGVAASIVLTISVALVQARVGLEMHRGVAWPTLLSSIAIGGAVLVLPPRIRARATCFVAGLLVVLVFADLLCIRNVRTIVPLGTPSILLSAWAGVPSAVGLLVPRDLVFLVALLGAVPLREAPAVSGRAIRVGGIVVSIASVLVALQFAREQRYMTTPAEHGVLTLHALDASIAAERSWQYASRGDVVTTTTRALAERPTTPPVPETWRRPGASVLLLQLESFDAWAVGLTIGGRPVTPVLDALAAESIVYTNAISQVGPGRSSDADLLVQASLHPPRTGLAAFDVDAERLATMPRVLRDRGYHTLSAVADAPGFWNARARHAGYGLERSLFVRDLGPGQRIGFSLADHLLFERLAPSLRALPKPFFAWIITLSTHSPYRPLPPEHRGLDVGDLAGTSLGHYLETVHYVDHAIGELLASLRRDGLLDDTIVAIYADHEEESFGDPARLRRFAETAAPSHPAPRDRIPMLVRLPGADRVAVRVSEPTGLIDLAPTLLSMLQIDLPASFLGHPRFPGVDVPVRRRDGFSHSRLGWMRDRTCTLSPQACEAERRATAQELDLADVIARAGIGRAVSGK